MVVVVGGAAAAAGNAAPADTAERRRTGASRGDGRPAAPTGISTGSAPGQELGARAGEEGASRAWSTSGMR